MSVISPTTVNLQPTTTVSVPPVITNLGREREIPGDSPNATKSDPTTRTTLLGQFMDVHSLNPVVKSFLIGSISGTCSTVLFQPLDLLKTRLQAPQPTIGSNGPSGMFTMVSQILRHEKLFGLWKGMSPSLYRCVPGVGIYFAYIHGMKLITGIGEQPTPLQAMLLGGSGRCFSGAIMIPFTVIKTRFESKVYQYGSIPEALKVIYRSEGIRGLTCGLLPTLLRDAPFSGLYLMMYTSAKKTVPQDLIESSTLGPYVRFSCGVVAGFGASLVTQPADVIKTKMQLYPHKFHSVVEVIPYVYQTYGLKGYFKGLMPRTIRRTLVAAMSWTIYEQVMQTVGLK